MRPKLLAPLFVPVENFNGIGPKLSSWIKNLCGPYALDVLWHMPTGINHRPLLKTKPILPQLGTLFLEITAHKVPRSRKLPCVISGTSTLGIVEIVFFHYHPSLLAKKLAIGKKVWISGKFSYEQDTIKVSHPDYIEDDLSKIPQNEVIYPLKAGANGKVIRKIIEQIIPILPNLPEEIDPIILKQHGWPSWQQAVKIMHSPQTQEDLALQQLARQRLAFDELLSNQIALHLTRRHNHQKPGQSLPFKNQINLNLPFDLTSAQKKCLQEIRNDLASNECMIRLLQGDVGSGKTVVALLAALQAIENNTQTAFLAPTDILARQHFEKIKNLCQTLPIEIQLLTSHEKGKKRQEILSDLTQGRIDLLIGTHAILEQNVTFKKLSFAIIDEQHRFGVKQRLSLANKEQGTNLLFMTATPIPRTLALTAYGDMDISVLNEKPKGRQPIDTRVIPLSQVETIISRLKSLSSQIYWVCPLVEESEESDLMAAQKRFQNLQKIYGEKVGLIHGKMKPEEKKQAMDRFISGDTKILVSTTVIEVGVDVPSAATMIVEHAERFGLASLHQLRGRVGRGQDKAICLLLHGRLSETGHKRLKILRDFDDGFKIAEADLHLRGAGEILGLRQSGLPLFHMANIEEHTDLLTLANQQAQKILTQDPYLTTPHGQAVKNMLYLFQKDTVINLLNAG